MAYSGNSVGHAKYGVARTIEGVSYAIQGNVLAGIQVITNAEDRFLATEGDLSQKVMAAIDGWGVFEIAPKKGYVSLRRKKQFAMLGPKTNERVELGLNLKDDVATTRIIAQKPGGMCQYAVALTTAGDVDKEVVAVLKKAFDGAG